MFSIVTIADSSWK